MPLKLPLPKEKSVVLHLHEGPDQGHTTDGIEKRRKAPTTWRNLNPRPPCHNVGARTQHTGVPQPLPPSLRFVIRAPCNFSWNKVAPSKQPLRFQAHQQSIPNNVDIPCLRSGGCVVEIPLADEGVVERLVRVDHAVHFFTQNLSLAAKNFSLFQIFLKLKNVISSSFTFFLYFKSNRFESLIVQKLTPNKINLSQVEATFLFFLFLLFLLIQFFFHSK